jgi:hypothetical protein
VINNVVNAQVFALHGLNLALLDGISSHLLFIFFFFMMG